MFGDVAHRIIANPCLITRLFVFGRIAVFVRMAMCLCSLKSVLVLLFLCCYVSTCLMLLVHFVNDFHCVQLFPACYARFFAWFRSVSVPHHQSPSQSRIHLWHGVVASGSLAQQPSPMTKNLILNLCTHTWATLSSFLRIVLQTNAIRM